MLYKTKAEELIEDYNNYHYKSLCDETLDYANKCLDRVLDRILKIVPKIKLSEVELIIFCLQIPNVHSLYKCSINFLSIIPNRIIKVLDVFDEFASEIFKDFVAHNFLLFAIEEVE